MSQKQYKIIFSTLAVVVFFLVFSQVQKSILPAESVVAEVNQLQTENTSVTVIIDKQELKLPFKNGQSLYETFLKAEENKQITFDSKVYPSLGFFITDINGLHGGNGENLIYYINGKEANVGVSSYFPKNGDVVLWKLE
ncbi:MAG: DUF4430 domain-containing protein [bacterium]|nr:DUF4430 domain-containing protein [bacterium]